MNVKKALTPMTNDFSCINRGSTLATEDDLCSLTFLTLIQETCRLCNPLFYTHILASFRLFHKSATSEDFCLHIDQLFKKSTDRNTMTHPVWSEPLSLTLTNWHNSIDWNQLTGLLWTVSQWPNKQTIYWLLNSFSPLLDQMFVSFTVVQCLLNYFHLVGFSEIVYL